MRINIYMPDSYRPLYERVKSNQAISKLFQKAIREAAEYEICTQCGGVGIVPVAKNGVQNDERTGRQT